MEGIDRSNAFRALMSKTLQREFVAVAPSIDVFGRRVPADDSRIRVHRDAVIHILVESFDGPFRDNHAEFWDAVRRRLKPPQPARTRADHRGEAVPAEDPYRRTPQERNGRPGPQGSGEHSAAP